jgi:hypothetical protein
MLNITRFLASCSANGLPPEDLFQHDDLIEATSDSLARVAKTIIALVKWAETPTTTHSHLLWGRGNPKHINTSVVKPSLNGLVGSPYLTGSVSPAVIYVYEEYMPRCHGSRDSSFHEISQSTIGL